MNMVRIAIGDLKRVSKDWRAVIWFLVMPMAFAYIFGSSFRSNGPQATWIPVINLDHHELAELFIDHLRGEGYWIEVKSAEAQADLQHKWPYGIVIPAGFGESILAGKPIKLPLVKGEASAEKILEVQSRLIQAIVRFTQELIIADTSHGKWDAASKAALQAAKERPSLLTVIAPGSRTLRPPPTGFSQSLPGMLVMFVVQMIFTYGGAILIKDRTGGQLSRLLGAPVFRFEVYVGKILGRVILALLQAALILICGALLFKIPFGDHPWFLFPVVLCLAAYAGCLSILAGLICQTEKQVILLAIFGSMFLAAMGGCWWPIEIVPDHIKTVAMFTPNYWAMRAMQSVLYFGRSYEVLTLECPVMLGFAALFGLMAIGAAKVTAKGRSAAG